jgi:osomolarity two-component system response regulator SSK1
MEWGCMQALIDFDGWRKWKDFSQKDKGDSSTPKSAVKGLGKSPVDRKREKRMSGSALSGGGIGSENLGTVTEAANSIAARA